MDNHCVVYLPSVIYTTYSFVYVLVLILRILSTLLVLYNIVYMSYSCIMLLLRNCLRFCLRVLLCLFHGLKRITLEPLCRLLFIPLKLFYSQIPILFPFSF